jgi:class 3 adenylate cyclase
MGAQRLPSARQLSRETSVLMISMVGVLYAVAGTGGLALEAFVRDDIAHPNGLAVAALGAVLVGVAELALAQWRGDYVHREVTMLTYSNTVLATAAVAFAQWSVGPSFVVVAIIFVEVPIFTFFVLPRREAFASIGVIGAAFGLILVVQPGYTAPVAQWLFLVTILVTVGIVIGGLLQRTTNESAEITRLRRFLPPALADALLSEGSDAILAPHRRNIAVLFCDLRGFTQFARSAEPEEVVEILNDYYSTVGEILRDAHATIGTFAGDGMMAYFNDPVPMDEPARTALAVAQSLRAPLDLLRSRWSRRGFDLGYGIGIATGYATLGVIGLEGRYDYTALGSVTNLASRLCSEAAHREILIDEKTADEVDGDVALTAVDLALKGFGDAVRCYTVSNEAAVVELRPVTTAT